MYVVFLDYSFEKYAIPWNPKFFLSLIGNFYHTIIFFFFAYSLCLWLVSSMKIKASRMQGFFTWWFNVVNLAKKALPSSYWTFHKLFFNEGRKEGKKKGREEGRKERNKSSVLNCIPVRSHYLPIQNTCENIYYH